MRRILVAALLLPAAPAVADCLAVQPETGEVRFEILQDGVPFDGAFRRFGGEVCFEEDRVASVDVWVEPASVDTGLPDLDSALQDPILFDSIEHPRITFVSEDIRGGPAGWSAVGDLTIKGITRTRRVPFTLERGGDAVQVHGEIVIRRLAFDVGTGEWSDTDLLSDEVTVRFRAALLAPDQLP